jgi:hypothetical protein
MKSFDGLDLIVLELECRAMMLTIHMQATVPRTLPAFECHKFCCISVVHKLPYGPKALTLLFLLLHIA